MAGNEAAIKDILNQVLEEYGGRISIDGGSKVLVSDTSIANAIHAATEPVRTPFGPSITVAARGDPSEDPSQVEGIAKLEPVDSLKMDFFSHAVFGVLAEDPKFILQGLKHTIYALQPKGIAIVVALKLESGQTKTDGGEEQFQISMEDKMTYQSKGKIQKLTDILEYAGFERGKIRSFERTTEAGGKKEEAEVILAMKWDQLNA